MARTLDQILSELNNVYAPSAQNIQSQIDLIPGQTAANISAADAAQQKAYQNIMTGAQQRGIGFSGIPLGEQANYASTVYAPAVLQAKNQGEQNRLSLIDTLNKLNLDKYGSAQNIQQNEISNDLAQQRLNASLSSGGGGGGGGYSPTLGDLTSLLGGGQGGQGGVQVGYSRGANGSFNFTDSQGHQLNAKQYGLATNQSPRAVLQMMANAGDSGAQQALQFVGGINQDNSWQYDPTKIKNQWQSDLFNALTGQKIQVNNPAQKSPVVNQSVSPFILKTLQNKLPA
jgi:hypothetical protein